MRRGMAGLSMREEEEAYNDDFADEDRGHELPESSAVAELLLQLPEGADVPDDVCAICLDVIQPVELAIVKGCQHEYCVNCILKWACAKEVARCPQCKAQFSYLYTHRQLDGSLSDAPLEESVCLLKRATWFVQAVQVEQRGRFVSAEMAAAGDAGAGPGGDPFAALDPYNDGNDEDEYDEEDQIEQYYFSSAAGHARVIIGNRRGGESGYIRSGRQFARPAPAAMTPNSAALQKSKQAQAQAQAQARKAAEHAGSGGSSMPSGPGSSSSTSRAPAAVSGSKAQAEGAAVQAAQQSKSQGRRARRHAKRSTADGDEDDDHGIPGY